MSDQPQSILKPPKQRSPPKKRVGIAWDEENLQKNEEEKEPRMKIDEPKTPYVAYEGSGDEDEPVFPSSPEEDTGIPSSHLQAAISRLQDDKQQANVWEMEEEEEDEGDSAVDHSHETEEFKRKRKMHYDEYLRLKQFREQHPNLSDDDNDSNEADIKDNTHENVEMDTTE
eukprot:gb/GECH01012660.1/.p1 GENE.gb/GECH01012660.1/~~gb/GECH01012660.1/.p1  ORF type:complete len:171 (+),score=52.94 gb/GECH01012660.1/:1-513(+)